MALCTNCGTQLSDRASACINCGHPTSVLAQGAGEYAGFGIRFAGAFIDGLVTSVIALVLGFSYRVLGGIAVAFLYHWLLVAFWDGQTLGKRVVGVRVRRPDGTTVDPAAAAVRSAVRIVSGFVFALGFLWAAWDPEKRTWHDMAADTRVVRVSATP